MSGWVDDYKKSEEEQAAADKLRDQAEITETRRYETIVNDWWADLIRHVNSDATELQKAITVNTDTSLLIQRAAANEVVCISVQPKLAARQLRLAYSHSSNGISFVSDGTEILQLRVSGSGHIQASGDDGTFAVIEDLSRYLLMQILNPTRRRSRPWA